MTKYHILQLGICYDVNACVRVNTYNVSCIFYGHWKSQYAYAYVSFEQLKK